MARYARRARQSKTVRSPGPDGSEEGAFLSPVQVSAAIFRHLSSLHLFDGLFEVVAQVLAQLIAHLARPARDAARVILVDVAEGTGVRELVEARLVGAEHREARNELAEAGSLAAGTSELGWIGEGTDEDALVASAVKAAILVNRHSRYLVHRVPGERRFIFFV